MYKNVAGDRWKISATSDDAWFMIVDRYVYEDTFYKSE